MRFNVECYNIMKCFCLIIGIKPKPKELREVRLSACSNIICNKNEGIKHGDYSRVLAKRKACIIIK